MSTREGFAVLCEHMVATLAIAPSRFAREFDRCMVITSRWLNTAPLDQTQAVFNPEGPNRPTPRDLSRPVHFATINDMIEGRGLFHAFAVRNATTAELRGAGGRVPFLSPFPHLRVTVGVLRPYAPSPEHGQHFASYHARERLWMRWGNGVRAQADEAFDRQVASQLTFQFSDRYNWHVYMRVKDSPRIALPVAPEQARKAFALRDIPPGRQRRAALRHWVSEHYRSSDDSEPIEVRSHFRGAEAFDWQGLTCEVEPSEYDRDRVGAKPNET